MCLTVAARGIWATSVARDSDRNEPLFLVSWAPVAGDNLAHLNRALYSLAAEKTGRD